MSLTVAQAREIFGEQVVHVVLTSELLVAKHPLLAGHLESVDKLDYAHTFLPEEVVLAMADHADCLIEFYTVEDGSTLYATLKEIEILRTQPLLRYKEGLRKVPIRQAILEYGTRCVFKAADLGIGYKWE